MGRAMSYRTSDLYLAAGLQVTLRLPLPNLDLRERLAVFAFQEADPAEAQRVADAFYNGTLTVHAHEFTQSLKTLKTVLNQRREGKIK